MNEKDKENVRHVFAYYKRELYRLNPPNWIEEIEPVLDGLLSELEAYWNIEPAPSQAGLR